MAETPTQQPAETYGIETVTPGITVESETITPSHTNEPIPNQKNQTTKEIAVDKRWDLKLTYRGTKLQETAGQNGEADIVTYGGHNYYVDTHEEAGSYNGLKRYNLNAHRFSLCPTQPQTQSGQGA